MGILLAFFFCFKSIKNNTHSRAEEKITSEIKFIVIYVSSNQYCCPTVNYYYYYNLELQKKNKKLCWRNENAKIKDLKTFYTTVIMLAFAKRSINPLIRLSHLIRKKFLEKNLKSILLWVIKFLLSIRIYSILSLYLSSKSSV